MSEENVELVRGILEQWAAGNVVAGVADFDSEVDSFMLFTFRGPRIVRMEMMLDQGEALEAAGLSE